MYRKRDFLYMLPVTCLENPDFCTCRGHAYAHHGKRVQHLALHSCPARLWARQRVTCRGGVVAALGFSSVCRDYLGNAALRAAPLRRRSGSRPFGLALDPLAGAARLQSSNTPPPQRLPTGTLGTLTRLRQQCARRKTPIRHRGKWSRFLARVYTRHSPGAIRWPRGAGHAPWPHPPPPPTKALECVHPASRPVRHCCSYCLTHSRLPLATLAS